MQNHKAKVNINFDANIEAQAALHMGVKVGTHWKIECVRDGEIAWVEEFDNMVVTAGLTDSLDKYFKGSTYTAAWYVGLTDSTPTFDPADTMVTHAGWVEVQTYDEATRVSLVLGPVSGGTVNNSASKAVFTISGTVTIGGAFLVTVNTKGGTTGVLYGGGAFSQDRAMLDNDVLNVTVTLTNTAA